MEFIMKKATEIIEGLSNQEIETIQINSTKRGFLLAVWFIEGSSKFDGKAFRYNYDREQFEFEKNL